jgi:putative ABC transport system permease protein
VTRPPRVAEWLVTRSLPGPDREAVIGDLCEEFTERAGRDGIAAANRWYWTQTRRSFITNVRRRAGDSGDGAPPALLGGSMQDLRYAVRALRKAPAFTAVVVLTLALGIGANTAIFSVVDAVLLRPLPYPQPYRIVSFAWRLPSGTNMANVSPLTFQYWQEHARSFDGFAATSGGGPLMLVRDGSAERVIAVSGTADFFKVIGVAPAIGRGFLPEECVPGAARVAVISDGLWRRVFGAMPDAIGRTITLSDRPYTVIGVMPAGFSYEPAADVWYPLQLRVDARDRGLNYAAIGRLRDGTTLEQAQTETNRIFQQFQAENLQHLPKGARTIELVRLQDFLVADLRPLLQVLLGAVSLVLLIACGNVANLLLTRSTARARDMAIRSALGAGRYRLARQTVIETLLLSLAGGLAGVALAAGGLRALLASIPGQLPRLGTVAIDYRVLGFALAVSALLGVVFGLLGAARLLRSDPGGVLKAAAGTGVDLVRHRLSNALVVGEVALSVVLLVGAGLLIATFMNLRGVQLGFETGNLLTVQLTPGVVRFGSPAAGVELDRRLIERMSAIPGVAAVTTASSLPLERGPNFIFGLEGEPPENINYVELRAVGPDYHSTLGIPLRAGRSLTASDAAGAVPVIVVNEALAKLLGGPQNALGKRLIIGRGTPGASAPREIVGIVSNVADGRPGTRLFPTLYIPRTQFGGGNVIVLIRTTGPVPIVPDVRRAVHAIDATLPIARIRTMDEVASAAVAQQRFNMQLTGVFAGTALALAMIGLYGLLSYQVAQRTREIGVRIALGARRSDVLAMVVRRGLILTAAGLSIGAAGALGLSRFLKTLLFGVTPTSPWVYAIVGGVLLAVATIASLVPARRAMRADPVMALRSE